MTIAKGVSGGVAGLDDAGKVPADQTQNVEDLNGNPKVGNYYATRSEFLSQNALGAFVYTTYITLITANLPAGNYRVGFSYVWNYNDTNNDFLGLVEVVGVQLITPPLQDEPKDSGTDQRYQHSGFDIVAWPGGVMTVRFQYGKSSAVGTARVYKAALEVERIP